MAKNSDDGEEGKFSRVRESVEDEVSFKVFRRSRNQKEECVSHFLPEVCSWRLMVRGPFFDSCFQVPVLFDQIRMKLAPSLKTRCLLVTLNYARRRIIGGNRE